MLWASAASAQKGKEILPTPLPPDSAQKWSLHYQFTSIVQAHPAFAAGYSSNNSLRNHPESAVSFTTTLFLGRKLWKGGALYFNPEVAAGKGVSSALGMGGFSNGECFRIGNPEPRLYLARLFFRQHIALCPETEFSEPSQNQLAEKIPAERITLTAGKFALADIFDDNSYSHNPRNEFMNWSLMDAGAWDYAANTRGYTVGLAAEVITPRFALRLGGGLEPSTANGPTLNYNWQKAQALNLELDKFFKLGSKKRPGALRLLVFRNGNNAPVYRTVINNYNNRTDTTLNVLDPLPSYGSVKTGWVLNAEQAAGANGGFFARVSYNDGKTATWAFTEIDRSASAGYLLAGEYWHRNRDQFGIAVVANGLSADHAAFFNAGGYGFMLGDGKLNYAPENILEAFYSLGLTDWLLVSLDYQYLQHPAYNRDRGPVNLFAARLHIEI